MLQKKKYRSNAIFPEDEVLDELGTETEGEKQIKVLLQKQLNTSVSLKEQFKQHKSFTCPSTYTPLTELVQGTCSLEQFKETEKHEELHQELQRCGLSDEEIKLYLTLKDGKSKGKLTEPGILNEKIKQIEAKIKTHHEDLGKPQVFSSIRQLTRHEMDLEKTLYAGCSSKVNLFNLVSSTENPLNDVQKDDVFEHIKNVSEELLSNCKNRKKLKQDISSTATDCDSKNSTLQHNPNIHHVIVPLEEDDVLQKRMTIEEIKKLPRFENYEVGELSKILYLQNLHPKVNIRELQSLFTRFEVENEEPIEYRIMTGRMRGQAFVQFTSAKLAEKALKFARGYVLREKPIIIKYGKKK